MIHFIRLGERLINARNWPRVGQVSMLLYYHCCCCCSRSKPQSNEHTDVDDDDDGGGGGDGDDEMITIHAYIDYIKRPCAMRSAMNGHDKEEQEQEEVEAEEEDEIKKAIDHRSAPSQLPRAWHSCGWYIQANAIHTQQRESRRIKYVLEREPASNPYAYMNIPCARATREGGKKIIEKSSSFGENERDRCCSSRAAIR
ncbi:unnamed protein product [Trichogramma brassicae]|uniref:Uncharacterized protein n=1 Tax=Trichogramma brassicae TaxID=86971 RepID=A0A6H5IK65_9HYME|nr:unnamed protein product [Trichogramma brassicae]